MNMGLEQISREERKGYKAFIMKAASRILLLATTQLLANILSFVTESDLWLTLNIVLTVFVSVSFVYHETRQVRYLLGEDSLALTWQIGDHDLRGLEIRLSDIVTIREYTDIESLPISYAKTRWFLLKRPAFRVRAARAMSYVSAGLARKIAGTRYGERTGMVIVYRGKRKLQACVFEPSIEMLSLLTEKLPDHMGIDDRLGRARLTGYRARCLERAFPGEYPYVQPLITQHQRDEADRENERSKSMLRSWIDEIKDILGIGKKRKKRKKRADAAGEAAELRRAADQKQAEKAKKRLEKQERKKKVRRSPEEDLLSEEPEEIRKMEIPDHPVIVGEWTQPHSISENEDVPGEKSLPEGSNAPEEERVSESGNAQKDGDPAEDREKGDTL